MGVTYPMITRMMLSDVLSECSTCLEIAICSDLETSCLGRTLRF